MTSAAAPADFSSFVTDNAGFRVPLRDSITPGDHHVGGIGSLGVRFYRAAGDDLIDGERYAVLVPADVPPATRTCRWCGTTAPWGMACPSEASHVYDLDRDTGAPVAR